MDDQQSPRSQSQVRLSQTGRHEDLPVLDDGEVASRARLLLWTDDAGLVQEALSLWQAYSGLVATAVLGTGWPSAVDPARHRNTDHDSQYR